VKGAWSSDDSPSKAPIIELGQPCPPQRLSWLAAAFGYHPGLRSEQGEQLAARLEQNCHEKLTNELTRVLRIERYRKLGDTRAALQLARPELGIAFVRSKARWMARGKRKGR